MKFYIKPLTRLLFYLLFQFCLQADRHPTKWNTQETELQHLMVIRWWYHNWMILAVSPSLIYQHNNEQKK